ncbi:MAG: triose-phosphate isomerase [bacterium]|nr:triose-phosphate isomerase [bacterium]
MRKTIIAGNWKMNGTVPESTALIGGILNAGVAGGKVEIVVCPPFTALESAGKLLKDSGIGLGAQNMSEHKSGAYTAEISAEMLLTLGVTHTILGHSERRQYHFETDDRVNRAAKAALAAGLTPIICVGETLEQRDSGDTEKTVGDQIAGTLAGFAADLLKKTVVAYEPVWAIGTGKTATPEMAEDVHRFIRGKIAALDKEAANLVPILYGGSVKLGNAGGLLTQPNIDGALVGGASLKVDDFVGIINAL